MNEEIILAPMEGVLDYYLRKLITSINQYDYCVSEFIRVYGVVFPKKIFIREVPELLTGGVTESGTPVWVQLLGSEPEIMAKNAQVCASLGVKGIDLNFGCPSKFVHRSNGGAAMLKNPPLLGEIVRRVRDALPSEIPLSTKIRLGWSSKDEVGEIFSRCIENGAQRVIIHARTKEDGYIPNTVKWEEITKLVKSAPQIKVTANGDIIDRVSAEKCMQITNTQSLMVGRYAIARPNLERMIRDNVNPLNHEEIASLLLRYLDILEGNMTEHYQKARTKQFFGFIRLAYKELNDIFKELCHEEEILGMRKVIEKIPSIPN